MEETVHEVHFETRRHASRPYSSNYPPQQQLKECGGGSLLSYIPLRGITRLKEKWSEYRQPRRLRRLVSLFVSERGDYVAVASGNQITILQKDNDFQEPVGTFTCGSAGTFTCGTWSESHELLGVADDTDTIYIVKPNGEEMTKITKKHLNVSSPIVGLIVLDDASDKKSYLCTFTVFFSDGSFYDIEISKDPSASIFSKQTLNNASMLRQCPPEICCWDYHQRLSLLALVSSAGDTKSRVSGSTGSSTVSIWRRKDNLQMEPLVSTQTEGSYSIPKDCPGQLTSPKVLFSPRGNFVASLDMQGCLSTFQFDEEKCSFSKLSDVKSCNSQATIDTSSSRTGFLHDIVDFTWWSDEVLTVAKRNGNVIMVDILNQVNISENDLTYSLPLLESAQQSPGLVFLLENTLGEDSYRSSEPKDLIERVITERPNQLDISKLEWHLVSFTKRSVLEVYDNLISSQRYQAALDFADRHGFDKDEVLKSQWLSSSQGVHEINTILPAIKDLGFILSECVDKVGPTEDAVRTLLSFGLRLTDSYRFSDSEDDDNEQIWDYRLARLKLLQYGDRLETFLGINMGRFSVQEYSRFRDLPIGKAALLLAESGKIGALNLLFKRHPYSLIPSMLEVLAAIPETIPVQSYGQLLPAISAPTNIVLRDEDWVECDKMVKFINTVHQNHESSIQFMTEPIIMKHMAFEWPSISKLSSWYKKRARDIDTLSGQLDNCMCLVELAIRKGISQLQQFLEDIFYLHQLIYSDEDVYETNFSMSLDTWEELPDYEKFKLIMMGANEDNVIPRIHKKAIPFMQSRFHTLTGVHAAVDYLTRDNTVDSFLVRWLKELASQNKLDMCLIIIEEGCRDMANHYFFKDEVELVDCALQCVYLCNDLDRWSTMSTILSKLPQMREIGAEDIKHRIKLAEGHVEAGRLLTYYQVPKPISFFLDAHADEKGVKQILRLLLSKFIRWQPARTDHDWANMWRDLQSLQEKAFQFLDLEYMLIEFCRGLLKAGKFSLARNYLKGTSSVALATDKAENLVIQAAREYFFSAPTLACPEIWKAKECLNIFPSSRNVRVEADIIDAITVRLPNLGVNLLPMAFRQIKDPMEIIKLAITSQSGAYLNVEELIEIAKLLGLSSQEDISTVQEAIAREAAYAGDMQLAFDLCLVLAKKGHGSVWDLCAALARSQALENMDSKSQKLLLGFALSHCDEESIGELLHEWKDLDMQDHCETLIMLTGREPDEFSEQNSSNPGEFSGRIGFNSEEQEPQVTKAKSLLSLVAQNLASENGCDWGTLLNENGKVVSFAASQLPWLLKLSEDADFGKKLTPGSVSRIQHVSIRTRAVMTILSWLTRSGFAPRDDLIASLAKSIMEPPVSDGEDVLGCSVLLNLVDAFHGAEIIEEQLKIRENYREFSSLMNVGMLYSLLHSYGIECKNPAQRRELLLTKFQEKHKTLSSDTEVPEAQSTFWNEWKVKLEQQKNVADKSRVLENLIPGVEISRFLSGDMEYIESVVFSLIESVKLEKKQILSDALILAHTYGLDRSKVLLCYLNAILVSEVWSVDDIMAEVSDFKQEILAYAGEVIKSISSSVYPAIDGHDKQRLAFLYDLLCDCYMQLEESKELPFATDQNLVQKSALGIAQFCKIVGQECSRISFIKGLDFKNIAGLQDLNFDCFNHEVCTQIDENNVEALAKMVQNLVLNYGDTAPEGLLSWKYVYTHFVSSSLVTLEGKLETETHFLSSEEVYSCINEIEQKYDVCKKYIRFMESPGVLDTVLRFFTIILCINKRFRTFPCDSSGKECLVKLINFWLRLMNDMEEVASLDISGERFYSECSMTCLKVLLDLLVKGIVSPNQGWCTLINYVTYGLKCGVAVETFNFCRAMIFCRCGFEAITRVFSGIVAQFPPGSLLITTIENSSVNIQDLPNLYLSILETILQELDCGSLGRQSLHHLLSSLSQLEGDLEDLKKVRSSVWERLSMFSNNLQLPSHLRVYALELMQFISGRRRNLDGFSSEGLADLLPWEGWDDLKNTIANQDMSEDSTTEDVSSRFTSTLVALKSSQLVSSISPSLEITPEDILSVDSAVSCFLRVSEVATTTSHVGALLAMLAEWEGLFTTGKDENAPVEVSDAANNSWSNDDWDEGWESFQVESVEKETKESNTLSIHPLHICWMTLIRKLVTFSSHRDALKLLDKNAGKSCRILLDEDDTRDLTQTALEVDCFLALKIALLLPYEAIQLQCLDAVEKKLKEGGIPDNSAQDHFMLVLVLSSGILSSIISRASYGCTISYLSFMVGNFSRRFQEAQASTTKHVGAAGGEKNKENLDFLFAKLLFPCFITELVKADQHILAGFLVTRFMHTNASLSLINIAEPSLRKYLEIQLQELQERQPWENMSSCEPLLNAVTNLRDKLGNLIQSALSLIPADIRKWRDLASDDVLWSNLFKDRWGIDHATFYAPDDSKSWKDVYIVQDRCDRVGLGLKIIREGDDYFLVHQGQIQRHLGSRQPESQIFDSFNWKNGSRARADSADEEQPCPSSSILDNILFFIGDMEVASMHAKRSRLL
ncbi:MAG2-interacting protein 2 [Sesamum alatum]|uniref:MAG2-interacting protein 2 n=1 Tax=Sesamum alatum TaxID=300844 RepID=A0AAE2CR03_9LAMI|nr:MAG2-interacting protein 2 [Sesamum alatum]